MQRLIQTFALFFLQEYSVQVTFREQWNDERLRYYDDTKGQLKYLTLTDPTKVWMPDTFFRNEKEARKHEIIVPNVYVRIFPNGEILYSIRYVQVLHSHLQISF